MKKQTQKGKQKTKQNKAPELAEIPPEGAGATPPDPRGHPLAHGPGDPATQ